MERITKFAPAYDRVSEGYGIGAQRIFFILKGDKGVVHFVWSTGILLEETEKRLAAEGKLNWERLGPNHYFSVMKSMGYDVGYHSHTKMHEWQEARPNCDWFDGEPCYGDGSAMEAERWLNILKAEGSDKIWEMLEELYKDTFETPHE